MGDIGCIGKIGDHHHGAKKGGTKPPRLPISHISKRRTATALKTAVVIVRLDITQPLIRLFRPRDWLTDKVFEHPATILQGRKMVTH